MTAFSEAAAKRNAKRKGRDNSLKSSRTVELRYLMVAKQITALWAAVVRKALERHEHRLVSSEDTERSDRFDAKSKAQRESIRAFAAEVSMQFGEGIARAKPIKMALQDIGKQSLAQSQRETKRLGIDLKKEPDMTRKLASWREDNLARIKSLGTDQVDRLREVLEESGDLNATSLRGLIEERVDVTRSKADLLARDQALKLNAAITKDRMSAAGIERYIWRTSRDQRVRSRHKELEGEEFRFDDPPETNDDGDRNNPGEDFQCRCVSEPILPELEDD